MSRDNNYVLELVKQAGLVTPEQLESAKKFVEEFPGEISIVDALVTKKVVSEADITMLLAQEYGLEMVDLHNYTIPPEVVDALPADLAVTYNVVPVMKHDDLLTVAMSDPSAMDVVDALRYRLNCDVEAVVATQDQIDQQLDTHYRTAASAMEGLMTQLGEEAGMMEKVDAIAADQSLDDDDAPIIKLVTGVIIDAYRMGASDIHMEPMEKYYRVRYRVDGVLREMDSPPKFLQANLTSRLKIMARLDITEKRIPQDGRINMSVGEKDIDLRVSSIPTTHGESIVMRILDKSSIQLDVPKLGFYADDMVLINRILSMPDGIFLVTGPTGSGKTTSLYAFLNTINTVSRKIITVEDPVEYQLPGINQVQVDRYVNMTFAAALRAILRQAPNIVMIGEIRDVETAEIAINAALTGHLVFSTLHTNDAPGAITRLVDMGVKAFLVASAVRAIMAQRLLRRVCKHCAQDYVPNEVEKHLLGLSDEYVATHTFKKGKGCSSCGKTGYKGRIGIYEICMLDNDITELVYRNEPTQVIREAARRNGMHSLRDDALRKAEAGISTLEEVIRVTMMDED
ncbi:MAG: Flp pilus assembly complex ATPase component TadA [Lentisphaeria bacterium]|nr:Flp pilus assembly complex ATPase component TadA [Lentisphaeria bacterium]